MADPLVHRAKKWTYLTWCDLRNHPFMLLGALVGAIVFVLLVIEQNDTNNKVAGVQHAVKVPRRCRVLQDPPPPDRIILICTPATPAQIAKARARANARNGAAARRRARRSARRHRATAGAPGSSNGSRGISHTHVPARTPHAPSGTRNPSPSPAPSAPAPRPGPTISVPSIHIGPVATPPITVPVPSLPLPRLPGG